MKIVKDEIITAVTALHYFRDGVHIFVGSGPFVYIYNVQTNTLVHRLNALENHIVHGFDLVEWKDCTFLAIYGQKQLRLYRIPSSCCIPERMVVFPELSDFIWDVQILLGNDNVAVHRAKYNRDTGNSNRDNNSRYIRDRANVVLPSDRDNVHGDGVVEENRDTIIGQKVNQSTDNLQPSENFYLAIGYAHNYVEIWNISTVQMVKKISCQVNCILYSFSFFGRSLDNLLMASGTVFSEVILWNMEQGIQRLQHHDGVIFRITWSICGTMLATVSDDRTVQLWNKMLSTESHQEKENSFKFSSKWRSWGHAARVWDVLFCPIGLVSCSEDATCKVWNLDDGVCLATFRGHVGKHVWRIALNPQENIVASGGGDCSIKLWDLHQHVRNGNSTDSMISFSPEDNTIEKDTILVEGDEANQIQKEKLSRKSFEKNDVTTPIRNLVVLPNGTDIYAVSAEGHLWKVSIPLKTWNLIYKENKKTTFCSVICAFDRELAIIADSSGGIQVIDPRTHQVLFLWQGHQSRVIYMKEYNQDEIFTCSVDGIMHHWKLCFDTTKTTSCTQPLLLGSYKSPGKCAISCLVVDEEKKKLYGGDGRGSLFVFDFPSSSSTTMPTFVLRKCHRRDLVTCLQIKDGFLYSAGQDGYLKKFQRDVGGVPLKLISWTSIPFISTIKQFWWDKGDLLVFGFHASNALLYNASKNYLWFSFPCGGWKRPHSLWTSTENNFMQNLFVYAPPSKKMEETCSLTLCTNKSIIEVSNVSFHHQYHGKLTTSVQWADQDLLLTGSEDNSLKLFQVDQNANLTCLQDSVAHTTGVRSFSISQEDFPKIVVSGGGKEMVNIWKLVSSRSSVFSRSSSFPECSKNMEEMMTTSTCSSTKEKEEDEETRKHHLDCRDNPPEKKIKDTQMEKDCHDNLPEKRIKDAQMEKTYRLDHLLTFERKEVVQDQRVLSTSILSLKNGRYIIITTNSEGLISILYYNLDQNKCSLLAELKLTSKPVLCCSSLIVPSGDKKKAAKYLLASGSTDGIVALWDISLAVFSLDDPSLDLSSWSTNLEPVWSFRAHDMGVNCLSTMQHLDWIVVASGGDDGRLSGCFFCLDENMVLKPTSTQSIDNASGSAIKAIDIVDNRVYTCGYDQRLSLWKVTQDLLEREGKGEFLELADVTCLSVESISKRLAVVGQGLELLQLS